MNIRLLAALALLVVQLGLAVLAVLVHHGLLAEYGDVTAPVWREFLWSLGQVGAIGLALVIGAGAVAFLVGRTPAVGVVAGAVPVLMLAAMLATTPLAQRTKIDVQYDAVPQCVDREMAAAGGPGAAEAERSQRAFESIEHVGWFGGGGATGVGGCDRELLLTDDADVLGHYRAALPAAGWEVVQEDPGGIRAERDAMAFELRGDGAHWLVWAGPAGATPRHAVLGDTSH